MDRQVKQMYENMFNPLEREIISQALTRYNNPNLFAKSVRSRYFRESDEKEEFNSKSDDELKNDISLKYAIQPSKWI